MDSIDPDKMVPYELLHLDLCYLQIQLFSFWRFSADDPRYKDSVTNDFAVKSNLLL